MGDGNLDTFVMFGAVYNDVATAEADYQTVKDLYYNTGLIDTFDAAVIGKNEKGKVKIYKKHEQPTRQGGWVGAGVGLAAGLVAALFPAAAIGTGLLAGTTATGAGLGAIAGHVAGGMDRSDLKDLGEKLDNGEAGLVVAAASDMEDRVAAAIVQADEILRNQAVIDAAAAAEELDLAANENS